MDKRQPVEVQYLAKSMMHGYYTIGNSNQQMRTNNNGNDISSKN